MNDAEGASDGRVCEASERDVLEGTQDLALSSVRMRRRIMSSGTREPAFMWDSASRPRGDCVNYLILNESGKGAIPNGVLLRTAFLKRSPELRAESWGNLFMRRSACVPLPTPGAPTSMIRAARLNSFVAIELDEDESGAERRAEYRSGKRGEKAEAARGSEKLKASVVRGYSLMLTGEKYVQLYRW